VAITATTMSAYSRNFARIRSERSNPRISSIVALLP
jgi:hypothetical protein